MCVFKNALPSQRPEVVQNSVRFMLCFPLSYDDDGWLYIQKLMGLFDLFGHFQPLFCNRTDEVKYKTRRIVLVTRFTDLKSFAICL